MRYEHEPRPEVEYHHHVKHLIERQQKTSDDRTDHREKQKNKDERDKMIAEEKMVVTTNFYCAKCKEDFAGQAVKQVDKDWNNPIESIAYYKTKCFKGHWCIRLITDKLLDPFFIKSRLLALDRGNHHADTLQPWETNYELLYSKKNK